MSNTSELDQLRQTVRSLSSQVQEAEAVIVYLRNRTVVLNNEVAHRDGQVAQRDHVIAALTQQLADAEPAAGTAD